MVDSLTWGIEIVVRPAESGFLGQARHLARVTIVSVSQL